MARSSDAGHRRRKRTRHPVARASSRPRHIAPFLPLPSPLTPPLPPRLLPPLSFESGSMEMAGREDEYVEEGAAGGAKSGSTRTTVMRRQVTVDTDPLRLRRQGATVPDPTRFCMLPTRVERLHPPVVMHPSLDFSRVNILMVGNQPNG